ncbi:MAG: hypothetical protein GX654_13420 [Desulfatiglans sp.]|nr:hypothetical protein [Desulfatiglans sp.]
MVNRFFYRIPDVLVKNWSLSKMHYSIPVGATPCGCPEFLDSAIFNGQAAAFAKAMVVGEATDGQA